MNSHKKCNAEEAQKYSLMAQKAAQTVNQNHQEQHVAEALRCWLMAQREPKEALCHLFYMECELEKAGVPLDAIGVTKEAYDELLHRGSKISARNCWELARQADLVSAKMLISRMDCALKAAGLTRADIEVNEEMIDRVLNR